MGFPPFHTHGNCNPPIIDSGESKEEVVEVVVEPEPVVIEPELETLDLT
jgi:hypothetical protein